ncbi:TetR family transcriptional regulator [Cupriavidus sp. UYMMa02A]|nr:TetR family transcriptional regulator [Cupriavidus sp. UYMMa02A]
MSKQRKPADQREKDLRLAMFRIQQGRARHTKAKGLSISAVAEEAGVTGPLIHNHYPKIAEAIRLAQGRDSRAQRDAKQLELKAAREKIRELRQEIANLRTDVSRLASINEVLRDENSVLRARLDDTDVVPLGQAT